VGVNYGFLDLGWRYHLGADVSGIVEANGNEAVGKDGDTASASSRVTVCAALHLPE
jgi:hypothetical protein